MVIPVMIRVETGKLLHPSLQNSSAYPFRASHLWSPFEGILGRCCCKAISERTFFTVMGNFAFRTGHLTKTISKNSGELNSLVRNAVAFFLKSIALHTIHGTAMVASARQLAKRVFLTVTNTSVSKDRKRRPLETSGRQERT